jgi:hypothetical protein
MPHTEAERLRLLAVNALAEAAQMTDVHCKHVMIGLAASYRRLADYAEARQERMNGDRSIPAKRSRDHFRV